MFTLVLGSDIWKSLQQLGCHHIRSSHKSTRGFALFVHAVTHTHTDMFNGPFSGTTQVSQYQKGQTNLDFTDARDSEWQWHQLGQMHVCTFLQTNNHTNTTQLGFIQAGCPSCRTTHLLKEIQIRIIIAFGHSTPGVQRSSCLVEFWFKWPSSFFYEITLGWTESFDRFWYNYIGFW